MVAATTFRAVERYILSSDIKLDSSINIFYLFLDLILNFLIEFFNLSFDYGILQNTTENFILRSNFRPQEDGISLSLKMEFVLTQSFQHKLGFPYKLYTLIRLIITRIKILELFFASICNVKIIAFWWWEMLIAVIFLKYTARRFSSSGVKQIAQNTNML